MTAATEIKKFVLQYLSAAAGTPLPQPQLEAAAKGAFVPRPLLSVVKEAITELERDGFILGRPDELEPSLNTWSLTDKGRHQAAKIG